MILAGGFVPRKKRLTVKWKLCSTIGILSYEEEENESFSRVKPWEWWGEALPSQIYFYITSSLGQLSTTSREMTSLCSVMSRKSLKSHPLNENWKAILSSGARCFCDLHVKAVEEILGLFLLGCLFSNRSLPSPYLWCLSSFLSLCLSISVCVCLSRYPYLCLLWHKLKQRRAGAQGAVFLFFPGNVGVFPVNL